MGTSKKTTVVPAPAPAITMDAVVAYMKSLSTDERATLGRTLKTENVAVRATKEKVYVAKRVQLVDTSATAKTQRKAGEEVLMTEKSLLATLECWVPKKDASLIPAKIASIKAGHTEDFKTFKIVGLTQ
jgi:hypothetical protein